MDNASLSFQDQKDSINPTEGHPNPEFRPISDQENQQPLDTFHNYLIQQPEEPLFQNEDNGINQGIQENEEKMMIVQQFLQNPYDPKVREKLNFSPQKILSEKFPELARLNFRNQYNFYKNLGTVSNSVQSNDKQNPARWEHLYEMVIFYFRFNK